MRSISLQIAKEFSCDVLVVGGGCAGLAAAVCSARNGAQTILAELNGFLGGTATAGLVNPFMTSYDSDGEVQLIRGFFDEFVTRMEEKGGALHPSKGPYGTAYTAYRTTGHRKCAAFVPECYKNTAEEMCEESGVKLMYHMMLIAADTENGSVTAAYFATKDGIYRICAKVFLDCTGDADLAVKANSPTVYGDEDGTAQAASLFFCVKGVDKEKLDAYVAAAPDAETRFYMREILAARANGEFPINRAKIFLAEGLNGAWFVNMSQIDDVDATSPEAITAAEIEGRKQVQIILDFLRKTVAGCEKISLIESAASLGIRESRRIIGEYVVTAEDAKNSVKFPDSVFCCSNSMDIHCKGYVTYIARNTNDPYYIPYRALQAKSVDNLLVAGRCVSADRAVLSAIRVMPPCFAMGQAAGTAAALSAVQNVSPKKLSPRLLIDTLLHDGVYLG